MPEARLEDSGVGLAPASDGWFVVNVRDAEWQTSRGGEKRSCGSECAFEADANWSAELGFNVNVLEPGEPNGLYHAESHDEAFLVLAGECTLLVDGEERRLRQWDYFRSPAGTEHIFVGAGDGPCAILMAGVRTEPKEIRYPASGFAARHGASAARETGDPREAYTDFEPWRRGRPSSWDRLPWA
jgi:uncharacterized cupin superfamily protein